MRGYKVYKDIRYALKVCRYGLPEAFWYKFYNSSDGLDPSPSFKSTHVILEFNLSDLEVEDLTRYEFEALGPIEPERVTIYEGIK